MVLTVSFELSPVTGLFCHRRSADMSCLSPVGPTRLRELDASVGASGPHDFAVRNNISRPPAVNRSRIQRTRPAIPSRAKRCRVHRTPPRVRDDHDTPLLWGGMRKVLDLIWGKWEQKYLSENQKYDSTHLSRNSPTGKSPACSPKMLKGRYPLRRPADLACHTLLARGHPNERVTQHPICPRLGTVARPSRSGINL